MSVAERKTYKVLIDILNVLEKHGAERPTLIMREKGLGFDYDRPTAKAARLATVAGELEPLIREYFQGRCRDVVTLG